MLKRHVKSVANVAESVEKKRLALTVHGSERLALAEELAALRGEWEREDFSLRLQIPEEKILIISDAHIPYHDEGVIAHAFAKAKHLQVEAIVWLGDLLDHPTYSSWGVDDLSTTHMRELDIAEGIIRMAAKIVRRQYWSLGNHEERWFRKVGNQLGMEHLARVAGLSDMLKDGTLVTSDNPSLDYHNNEWLLTHPADYSGTPLTVPSELAEKFGRNVVGAHAHHWAQGKSKSGRFIVIESGGAFAPKLVKYTNHRVTRHRTWVQGYVILDHGQATLYEGSPVPDR